MEAALITGFIVAGFASLFGSEKKTTRKSSTTPKGAIDPARDNILPPSMRH